MLYSSDLIISHQVFCGIDHTVVRCLSRLDRVTALSFHRLGCCHMKCCVPYIFVCYLMEKFCFPGLSFFFFEKFCFRRLVCCLTGNSISVDLVIILRKKFTFTDLIIIL